MGMMGQVAAAAADWKTGSKPWWERRWLLALVVLATMLPLLYPAVPPLVDLPGHIGRYRVELDLARSPFLQRYYDFHWAAMGNLGLDLLVLVLAPLLGLEPAVKLIIVLIPTLTAAGFLWVAREIHGRVPPTAYFALPFIYSFPLLYGFANFALSSALAFLAFGLWLRLGPLGLRRLRTVLFVPISFLIFFCHTYGLGLLGLMCFSAEVVGEHERGRGWARTVGVAALRTAGLSLPLLVMVLWPSGSHEQLASEWFNWEMKWGGLYNVLRDRWGPFDVSSLELAGIIFLFGLVSPKLSLAPKLGLAAAVLAVCFVLMPRFIMESAYADVRLLPFLFAIMLLAIRQKEPADNQLGSALAAFGLLFFVVRLAGTTVSLTIAARAQEAKLEALNHVPRGARVASFVGLPAAEPWAMPRESHIGALVIARREGFSNDQWLVAAHNLLQLKYRGAGDFSGNPSEIVRPNNEHDGAYRTVDEALTQVPRTGFDYVWLLNPPAFDKNLVRDMEPVWSGRGALLYRIPHPRGQVNSL